MQVLKFFFSLNPFVKLCKEIKISIIEQRKVSQLATQFWLVSWRRQAEIKISTSELKSVTFRYLVQIKLKSLCSNAQIVILDVTDSDWLWLKAFLDIIHSNFTYTGGCSALGYLRGEDNELCKTENTVFNTQVHTVESKLQRIQNPPMKAKIFVFDSEFFVAIPHQSIRGEREWLERMKYDDPWTTCTIHHWKVARPNTTCVWCQFWSSLSV